MPDRAMTCASECELMALAAALGAADSASCSPAEDELLKQVRGEPVIPVGELRRRIHDGEDVLGELFSKLRSAADRRSLGATYTPQPIVRLMLDWAAEQGVPSRVVDPGVGSARFLVEAGRRFPKAELVGVEIDPVAALLARAHLAAAGMASRSQVLLQDYRSLTVPRVKGRTLFIGNPPYVRHHLVEPQWKEWLVVQAKRLGVHVSQLAGLHAYFYVATALLALPGDYGAFITAAEWLDVNYGRLIRELFLGKLGGHDLVVLEPTARPFPDAAATAAVATFVVGEKPASIRLSRADDVDAVERLGGGRPVHRDRLATEQRWSRLTRGHRDAPTEYVELGELCRVHRGAVTGANKVWIAGEHSRELPESVLFPSVTRARELIEAGQELATTDRLRRVIDLPVELDGFEGTERRAIDRFLKAARSRGAHKGYVATHRRAWWSIGLREPPPVMATYMARRPPAFVRNLAEARYINIAHGLYPRIPLTDLAISNLIAFLSHATSTSDGRTYAGGLTKFEPREMERLLVPAPEMLEAGVCE
jgi:adenine-specific DNA-methyltransferase